MRWVLAVMCSLLFGAVYGSACSTFGEAADEASDGGAGEASACTPPACGAPSGSCGMVSACGLAFSCGECAAPYSCVNGSCQCPAAPDLCAMQGAKCGELDNGCGATEKCGQCDGGTSCQVSDAGLACVSGGCVPEPKATTCAGKCNNVTNNCGALVACGTTCAQSKLCAADGKKDSCTCPPRPFPLIQYFDAAGYFCYSQTTLCPGANPIVIAKLYAAASPGLVPLYRCRRDLPGNEHAYLLTTFGNCEALQGFVLEGPIGSCSRSSVCGATALHRYVHPSNGNIVHGFGPAPLNYLAIGDACYVWGN